MDKVTGLRVSVDVGCYQHSVAVGLADGTLLDEFELAHDPTDFDEFFERILRLCQQHVSAVSEAMEGYNGWARPLDTLVRTRGYRLFNINNLKLARFKEIFPAAAKTDQVWSCSSFENRFQRPEGVLQEVQGVPL